MQQITYIVLDPLLFAFVFHPKFRSCKLQPFLGSILAQEARCGRGRLWCNCKFDLSCWHQKWSPECCPKYKDICSSSSSSVLKILKSGSKIYSGCKADPTDGQKEGGPLSPSLPPHSLFIVEVLREEEEDEEAGTAEFLSSLSLSLPDPLINHASNA